MANKANSVEANQKIIELQGRMSEVQQTFAELLEENQKLKDENRVLWEELKAESLYPMREGVRWKKAEDGEKRRWPVLSDLPRQQEGFDATPCS